jgi:hypothetical protein
MGLRAQLENDLAESLESPADWGLPVILIDPDGVEYTPVNGQVLYDTVSEDEQGLRVVQHKPVVTLRRTSLTRIPLPSEKNRWIVKMREGPLPTSSMRTFVIGGVSEGGDSLGIIRLYLHGTRQS